MAFSGPEQVRAAKHVIQYLYRTKTHGLLFSRQKLMNSVGAPLQSSMFTQERTLLLSMMMNMNKNNFLDVIVMLMLLVMFRLEGQPQDFALFYSVPLFIGWQSFNQQWL